MLRKELKLKLSEYPSLKDVLDEVRERQMTNIVCRSIVTRNFSRIHNMTSTSNKLIYSVEGTSFSAKLPFNVSNTRQSLKYKASFSRFCISLSILAESIKQLSTLRPLATHSMLSVAKSVLYSFDPYDQKLRGVWKYCPRGHPASNRGWNALFVPLISAVRCGSKALRQEKARLTRRV